MLPMLLIFELYVNVQVQDQWMCHANYAGMDAEGYWH